MGQDTLPLTVSTGLSGAEAARRRERYGPNWLPTEGRPSAALAFPRQFVHLFALLLWGAAGLAVAAGMPQLGVAIVIVILVNGGFAFVQEYRADRAVDRLRDLLTAVVRRDGRRQEVPAVDLVPGDVVLMEAGDRVSADLRTSVAVGLAVDESLLTGESVPRRVDVGEPLYAGTFVVEGTAEAVVTATAGRTRLAGIADLTRQVRRPLSPLAVRLNRVVSVVAAVAIGAGIVLFGLSRRVSRRTGTGRAARRRVAHPVRLGSGRARHPDPADRGHPPQGPSAAVGAALAAGSQPARLKPRRLLPMRALSAGTRARSSPSIRRAASRPVSAAP